MIAKGFSVVDYICLFVQLISVIVCSSATLLLRNDEFEQFLCVVDSQSTALYKTYVKKACHSRYEQTYNLPLPLYLFAMICLGFPLVVSVGYSMAVSVRVKEIIDRTSNGSDETTTNGENAAIRGRKGTARYVFNMYFMHLVFRFLSGVLFIVLQKAVFYPSGFHSQFTCILPTTSAGKNTTAGRIGQANLTSIICENAVAGSKGKWGDVVYFCNVLFASIVGLEVFLFWLHYLILKCESGDARTSDEQFVTIHLLRKRHKRFNIAFKPSTYSVLEVVQYYKKQVLGTTFLPGINYSRNVGLDEFFINCVFSTGQAGPMTRREIFDVDVSFPENCINFERIVDLFYRSTDTKGIIPRRILVFGRPGIGKSVLIEKVMLDWANEVDEFYRGKIAFYFNCRWFSFEEFKNISLKQFCMFGTRLSKEKFESIFEEILKEPSKAIFIFDGLDEVSTIDYDYCQCQVFCKDFDHCIPAKSLLIKLFTGQVLPDATVLATSRATADTFLSRFPFDRLVEIVGFPTESIEEYVSKFCDNHNRRDLKQRIWGEIQSSSDLLNLCCIPACCFTVCVALFSYHSVTTTEEPPLTLTELYATLVRYYENHHTRDKTYSNYKLETLQSLAFHGIQNEQVIFNEELVDEEIKRSGLLHALSSPMSQGAYQFCFLHLTIQEFLAAKHVTETSSPDEIKVFISSHARNVKWHLVLQFVHELLQKKMNMSGSDAYRECILLSQRALENIKENYLHDNNSKVLKK